MSHDVQWYSPAPLWTGRLQNGTSDRLQQPALLRFEQDDFMGELGRVLTDAPGDLDGQLAEESEEAQGEEPGDPLSFYQPAHQRYYVVTASLVCRERGLPDRGVDTTNDERTAFVLRRLVTREVDGTDRTREYGWTGSAWKPLKDPETVANAEQPLKMFPKSYAPASQVAQMKGGRRVWAGLIPAAKRDTFETAPLRHDDEIARTFSEARTNGRANGAAGEAGDEGGKAIPPKGYDLSDPRKTKFAARVMGAFQGVADALNKPDATMEAKELRDPIVFAWLDLWQFLGQHFDGLQARIEDDTPIGRGDSDVLRVLNEIDLQVQDSTGSEVGLGEWKTAIDALKAVAAHEDDVAGGTLDGVLKQSDVPSKNDVKEILNNIRADEVTVVGGDRLGQDDSGQPALQDVVDEALGDLNDPSQLTDDLQPPATTETAGGGRYVVRCLYERPNCPPSARTTVSDPSETFQLASFFDAGAPARDINIALPSAAMSDLRDSDQSVNMVFTKELRRQAERVQNITLDKLQDGDVGEAPSVDIGMICSLSIPIITICALILLLIIVVVLNIVFWWLPFFKICFPIPTVDSD